jgi:zinc transporter ZupT
VLLIAVMTLHSFSEGVGIGVSFGGSSGHRLGPLIGTTLCVHNIPEGLGSPFSSFDSDSSLGLAVALVLVPQGIDLISAAVWCILTSLPQPLTAVPAFLFIEHAAAFLPVGMRSFRYFETHCCCSQGLGFAAGAMIWVCLTDLVSEARNDLKNDLWVVVALLLSAAAMVFMQYSLGGSS